MMSEAGLTYWPYLERPYLERRLSRHEALSVPRPACWSLLALKGKEAK